MPDKKLAELLERATDEGRTVEVFLRDDDVDCCEPRLFQLEAFLRKNLVPCNLAVIPGLLEAEAADYLKAVLSETDSLISLSQHGYRHLNHEATGRKCEFGDSRSFDEQYGEIHKGRELLRQYFPGLPLDTFVPPWNRCSRLGLRAVKEAGFRIFSGWEGKSSDSNSVVAATGLQPILANVDIFSWGKKMRLKEAAEVDYDICARLQSGRIGILLHHKLMEQAALDMLEGIVDTLRQAGAVSFRHLSSLGG